MCTYRTDTVTLAGSAKGGTQWFPTARATVYFDHPVHAPAGHTLNVDVWRDSGAPAERVALELDPQAARALARTILRLLDDAERDGLLPAS